MRLADELGVIVDRAIGCGILNKRAENCAVEFERRVIADGDLDSERPRACLNHGDGVGMTIIRDKKCFSIWYYSVAKCHRFGSGRRFVQHGSVRDVERRQIKDHLLEVQQRFESPLCDFRLVRRVSGIPARVFKNVALNDRRRDAVVIASPDKRPREFVLLCNRPQFSQRFDF